MSTINVTRSNVMKAAWKFVKTAGLSLSEALRKAWATIKNTMKKLQEYRFNGKVYGKKGSYSIYVNSEKLEVTDEQVEAYNSFLEEREKDKAYLKMMGYFLVTIGCHDYLEIPYKEFYETDEKLILAVRDRIMFEDIKDLTKPNREVTVMIVDGVYYDRNIKGIGSCSPEQFNGFMDSVKRNQEKVKITRYSL